MEHFDARGTLEERFWAKVLKPVGLDGCWEWQGATTRKGYGYFRISRSPSKCTHAHRFSWTTHFGEIPEGVLVCHKCDNPSCVNPDHLFLGTQVDNTRDSVEKGRQWSQKLTLIEVEEVRELYSNGQFTQRELGEMFGCHGGNIGKIVRCNTFNF